MLPTNYSFTDHVCVCVCVFWQQVIIQTGFFKDHRIFLLYNHKMCPNFVFHTSVSRWLRKCPIFFTQELSTMSLVIHKGNIGCGKGIKKTFQINKIHTKQIITIINNSLKENQ